MPCDDKVSKETSYALSHIVILKFFVLWGILETVLYLLTNGDKKKELIIHVLILFTITVSVYVFPQISEHVK